MNSYLCHSLKGSQRKNHKYIARKWVKGKWQYIYDKIGGNAFDASQKAEARSKGSEAASDRAYQNIRKAARADVRASLDKGLETNHIDKAMSEARHQYLKTEHARAYAEKAYKKYAGTVLGKLNNKKISKAVSAVNRAINKL